MAHLYPLKIGSAVELPLVPVRDREDYRCGKPKRPCARSGHCAVADENNVYLFGGYNPDERALLKYFRSHHHEPLFGEVWRYHITSNRWHLLTGEGDRHFRLASMSAIRRGKTVLLYGGTSFPFGYKSSNEISWFDVKRVSWQHRPGQGNKKPIRSYGQAVAIIGPYLYVYGGTTGWVYCSDIHRCHLQTDTWERVFDTDQHTLEERLVPDPRYRHEMLADDKRLYVIGGGTSGSAFPLDKLNAFNIERGRWELIHTEPDERHGFPGARRCHGCAQLENVGYITGGFNGKVIYDDVWMLSLATHKWTKLEAKLPRPVYFHSSAITPNGCLFVHGGVLDQAGKQRTDQLVRIWVRLPSLLLLSWNRILSLLKNPTDVGRDTLHAMGVPPALIPEIG